MPDQNKRALLIEAVITAGLIAVGIPTGQVPLAVIVAAASSVGGNWAYSLATRGFQHWCDGWLTDDGVLNHDIEQALCQAYIQAIKQLEQDCKPHYEWLQRKDKAEAEATVYALQRLRKDGAHLLLQPKQRTQQAQHARALSFLYQDNVKANEYLNGYNDVFITFVAERLGPQWVLRFAEILKDPDKKREPAPGEPANCCGRRVYYPALTRCSGRRMRQRIVYAGCENGHKS